MTQHISNVEKLLAFAKQTQKENAAYKRTVLVCGGTGCTSSGSNTLYEEFISQIAANKLQNEVKIIRTGCFGLCALGPIVIVNPESAFYSRIKLEDVTTIVKGHIVGGKPVTSLLYAETVGADGSIKSLEETGFYRKQKRAALRNCGRIDPEDIADFIAHDGYQALAKCLTELTPAQVIDEVKKSGLRGRGGAGFPTATKWEFAAKQVNDVKYVCCNADEGDPGAFMDRSTMEGDPHAVLEAMAIAGYAIGAHYGYVYIRAEYPIAVHRLRIALKQAREAGLLGKNILGKGFDFDVEIKLGAGAFVCGEETALMASVEGKRGEPRVRPPFPAIKGLFGRPTILNNVETLANIPQIILGGGEKFAAIGTEKSKGTKIFALGGKINHTGLVEVPMGITLREIIYDIGGGIPGGKKFKAAQTGGPSGGCITEQNLDVAIDFDNLVAIGSMMGSGGMIVMDEDNCMVDIAKFFLEFIVDESCGKCTPCRIGTKRLLELVTSVTEGTATMETLTELESLAAHLKDSSLCALGQTAANPVLSTMRYFKDEYIAHVIEKRCPAGVCKGLLKITIAPEKCIGCGLCKRSCPVAAIQGEIKQPHIIDPDKCVRCGLCVSKCPKAAIFKK